MSGSILTSYTECNCRYSTQIAKLIVEGVERTDRGGYDDDVDDEQDRGDDAQDDADLGKDVAGFGSARKGAAARYVLIALFAADEAEDDADDRAQYKTQYAEYQKVRLLDSGVVVVLIVLIVLRIH